MRETGPPRFGQDGLHFLVDQLRDDDAVAIIAYDHEATDAARDDSRCGVDQRCTPPSTSWKHGAGRIWRLVSSPAYQVARQGLVPDATNRVVLISDSLANVGETSASTDPRTDPGAGGKQISPAGSRRVSRLRRPTDGAPGRPGRWLRHLRLRT